MKKDFYWEYEINRDFPCLAFCKPPLQRNLVNQQVTFIVKLKILFDFIFCLVRRLYPVLPLYEEHIY